MSGRNLREERRESRRALSRDQIMDVAERLFARKVRTVAIVVIKNE
jgi:hypothetical protein